MSIIYVGCNWRLQVERKRRHVDLSMRDVDGGRRGRQSQPKPGEMVTGRVAAIASGGVRVQLTPRSYGRLALTDLHDRWVSNALKGTPALALLGSIGPPLSRADACCCTLGGLPVVLLLCPSSGLARLPSGNPVFESGDGRRSRCGPVQASVSVLV